MISLATSGDGVVLAAQNAFINNAGAGGTTALTEAAIQASGGQGLPLGVFTAGARFLIYSASSGNDVFGGLNSNNMAIWGVTYPTAVTATGNRYVFATQPTATLQANNVAATAGIDNTAALQNQYALTGLQPGLAGVYLADTSAIFSGAPALTSQGAGATAAAGTYAINIAPGTLAANNGSQYLFKVANGVLTLAAPANTGTGTNTGAGTNTGTGTGTNTGSGLITDNVPASPTLSGFITSTINVQSLPPATPPLTPVEVIALLPIQLPPPQPPAAPGALAALSGDAALPNRPRHPTRRPAMSPPAWRAAPRRSWSSRGRPAAS